MNSKVKLALSLLLLSSTVSAQTMMGVAEIENQKRDNIQVVGTAEFKDVIANSVQVTGPLSFKNLTVHGKTEMTGPMKGKKGTFSDINVAGSIDIEELTYTNLKVVGKTELKKATATGKTDVIGELELKKSKVKDIFVTSDEIELEDSETGQIVIRKNDGSLKIQELDLKGECVINGDITFEAGKGLVKMGSKVKHIGTVKGAEVKKS